MTPVVSVVIPTYNRRAMLARALASIRAQAGVDVEILVVDDGSTDGTASWVADQPHPVRFFQQANAGPAAARNVALSAATGAFFAFLDSDDEFLPGHLRSHLEVLERDPAVGLVYGASEIVEADGSVVKIQRPQPENRGRVLPQLLRYNFVMPSTVVMRRECYEWAGPMEASLHFAEDWLFWLKIAGRFPFDYVPDVTVRFQRTPGSASRRPLEELVAMNRAMFDLAFTDPKLGPVIAGWRAETYGAMYEGYARTALETSRLAEARRFLREAWRLQPGRRSILPLYLKSLIPGTLLAAGRSYRRGM